MMNKAAAKARPIVTGVRWETRLCNMRPGPRGAYWRASIPRITNTLSELNKSVGVAQPLPSRPTIESAVLTESARKKIHPRQTRLNVQRRRSQRRPGVAGGSGRWVRFQAPTACPTLLSQ